MLPPTPDRCWQRGARASAEVMGARWRSGAPPGVDAGPGERCRRCTSIAAERAAAPTSARLDVHRRATSCDGPPAPSDVTQPDSPAQPWSSSTWSTPAEDAGRRVGQRSPGRGRGATPARVTSNARASIWGPPAALDQHGRPVPVAPDAIEPAADTAARQDDRRAGRDGEGDAGRPRVGGIEHGAVWDGSRPDGRRPHVPRLRASAPSRLHRPDISAAAARRGAARGRPRRAPRRGRRARPRAP